jgi:hypothetical protein
MLLTVTISSVQLAGAQGISVSGTGSPNGANIAVQITMKGGVQGNNATLVNNGLWNTIVPMQQVSAGQSGKATATATDEVHFPGQSVMAETNFVL